MANQSMGVTVTRGRYARDSFLTSLHLSFPLQNRDENGACFSRVTVRT